MFLPRENDKIYRHIDLTTDLKKSRSTRLSSILNFPPSAKEDVICPNQIRDVLSACKRKQMDSLLMIKPHLQLKRWKNKSNNQLKSFLSLSRLKVIVRLW